MATKAKQQMKKTEEIRCVKKPKLSFDTVSDDSSGEEMIARKVSLEKRKKQKSKIQEPPLLKQPKIDIYSDSNTSSNEETVGTKQTESPQKKVKQTKRYSDDEESQICDEEATMFLTGHKEKPFVLFKTGYSPLSNFYPKANFTIDGEQYNSVEQWTAASKARFCKNDEILQKIMETKSPSYARILKAKLKNDKDWMKKAYSVTKLGIEEKFKQNRELQKLLLKTGSATIGEASEYNIFWTTGVDISEPNALNPKKWSGKNMMGNILMSIRDNLKS